MSDPQIFVTKDTKSICIPWREDLANLIPHSRELAFKGNRMLVIPNEHNEAKVARNVGVPVPAPILTRYDWPTIQGFKPWDIQKTTAALLTESSRAYVLNTMGCVDADTEYLSPTGWQRIADYRSGAVAQYHPDTGSISFVEPTEYVKLPCPEMIRFKTTRGVDQLLSPEHRVLFETASGVTKVMSAEAVEALYPTVSDRGVLFRTTFTVDGQPGLPLTDAQLRLQVAVNADGHQMPYATGKVSVRLKKQRKIDRLVALLTEAGVPYVSGPSGVGYTTFRFVPPEHKHSFAHWWTASQAQLLVIADEAPLWDGSCRKASGVSFSANAKMPTDFIQYAFSASGRRASLSHTVRQRRGTTEHEWSTHAGAGSPLAGLVGVNADGTRRQNVWREPSPDGFKYCFMVPTTFLLLRRNGCIFATGNTGKTRSCLFATDYMFKHKIIKKVLICAPLSTLDPVWANEIFAAFPQSKYVVLHGSRKKRLELLNTKADYYIINHHGAIMLAPELVAAGFDVVIIDELAVFRNKSTELWKGITTVVNSKSVQYAWGLTGSPIPNAPTDAWAQMRMLTPGRTTKTMGQFKDLTMKQITTFKWLPRHDALQTVHSQMKPSVRFTRDDVGELPETTYMHREVKLSGENLKAYTMLVQKMRMMTQDGQAITAVNEGVLQMKLLQVACGFIYTDKQTVYQLPIQDRLDACLELVESTDRKVIVFVPFVHALNGVADFLRKAGQDVRTVYGATALAQRNKIFHTFQHEPEIKVLVAHPQCMAHGLTLTAANTTIWFAPVPSLEIYEQANARTTRPGQTSKTLIAHLGGTAVERVVYKRLQEKGKMQGALLQLFHSQDLEY